MLRNCLRSLRLISSRQERAIERTLTLLTALLIAIHALVGSPAAPRCGP